jgi:hypothetical protein
LHSAESLRPNGVSRIPAPVCHDGYPLSPRMKSHDQTRVYKESNGGELESRVAQAFPRQELRRRENVGPPARLPRFHPSLQTLGSKICHRIVIRSAAPTLAAVKIVCRSGGRYVSSLPHRFRRQFQPKFAYAGLIPG